MSSMPRTSFDADFLRNQINFRSRNRGLSNLTLFIFRNIHFGGLTSPEPIIFQ